MATEATQKEVLKAVAENAASTKALLKLMTNRLPSAEDRREEARKAKEVVLSFEVAEERRQQAEREAQYQQRKVVDAKREQRRAKKNREGVRGKVIQVEKRVKKRDGERETQRKPLWRGN